MTHQYHHGRCRARDYSSQESNGSASPSRLYRDPTNGYLFGVASGIAGYFGIEPWIVRALIIFGMFFAGPPLVIGYVILAVALPRKPDTLYRDDDEARFWSGVRVDPSQSFSKLRHRFRNLEQRLRSMEAYMTSDAYRVHREINDLDR